MTNHINPPYVPSDSQYLAAIQVILDNRRHAQNVIRFQKLRVFFFVSIALLATIAAATHFKRPSSSDVLGLSAGFASSLLPGLILLATPIALWPSGSIFPGATSRNATWHLGLGHGEAASLASIVSIESDALKKELWQVDIHGLICGCTCILCTFQFVAAGLMILHP